jgi:hypothetical protein
LSTFVDQNNDGFADDINRNNIYGPDGQDIGTPFDPPPTINPPIILPGGVAVPGGTTDLPPTFIVPLDGIPDGSLFPGPDGVLGTADDIVIAIDFGDLATTQPIFDEVILHNAMDITTVELMYMVRSHKYWHGIWEMYFGARYAEIDEEFSFFGSGSNFDPMIFTHKADNHIVGPQIGLRWFQKAGRWTASSEGRFMAGANFQGIHQEGEIGGAIGALATTIGAMNFHPSRGSFANSLTHEAFAPIGEVRFDLSFDVTRDISLTVGYTAMIAGGIARASNTIDWVVPQLGVLKPGGGEDLIANGVNFGVEVNR